jgi:nondiscriminating glutamyl-tRNA synthetase
LQKAGLIPDQLTPEQQEWVTRLIGLNQERMQYAAEIVPLSQLFFQDDVSNEDEEAKSLLAEEHVPVVLQGFLNEVAQAEVFAAENIPAMLKAVQKATGYKGKQLFMTIRVALTGQTHGPDLNVTVFLLGKDKVTARLNKLL